MTATIGIDNGVSGGLAWLNGLLDTDPRSVIPMPIRQVGKSSRPDVKVIKAWLNENIRTYGRPGLVVIEKSQTMRETPGKGKGGEKKQQGSVQAHTQGLNAGVLLGIFEFLDLPIEEPPPQSWKAAVLKGFGEKNKEAMIAVCRQRFPSLSLLTGPKSKKPHDGMADAMGLALFAQFRIGNVLTLTD